MTASCFGWSIHNQIFDQVREPCNVSRLPLQPIFCVGPLWENQQPRMDKLLKPHEVAELLGVEKSTIYQWTHQGFIPHVKLRNLVRFRPKAIAEWVEKREQPGRRQKRMRAGDLGI